MYGYLSIYRERQGEGRKEEREKAVARTNYDKLITGIKIKCGFRNLSLSHFLRTLLHSELRKTQI